MKILLNSQGVQLGPNGHVLCLFPGCRKEAKDISRETGPEFALCSMHRVKTTHSPLNKETDMSKPKKEKKERVKGQPQRAILWFQEKAAKTQDLDEIRRAARAQEYADNTITIQIGRLRGMGLLPKAEPKEKKAKGEGKKKPKATSAKRKDFHPAPKPSQKDAAA